ncbi:MAG: amidohydrolase [Vicinamibacterales bacterium]
MAARLTNIIVTVIVAATIIAGIIAGAQRDDSAIDLIVLNGKVYTAADNGRIEEAVAVRGNQIVRVGTNREIKRLRRPQTRVIDAHGGSVLPGFNDARAHLAGGIQSSDEINLYLTESVEHVQETIRAYADANRRQSWIVGRGWTYAAFPGGMPTRQQLDAVVKDRPAYFVSRDGRTGWANSKALKQAGITRRTTAPPNGVIVTDPVTGQPTGALKNDARQLVERLLTPSTQEDHLHALRARLLEARQAGITSVHSAGDDVADLELYDELRQDGDLTVRVYGVVSVDHEPSAFELDELDRLRVQYPDDPLLKTGAVALSIDGSVESQTASLLGPYTGRKIKGRARYTAEELQRTIGALDERGWQIVMDAAGNAAVKLALDAYSRALPDPPSPGRDRRHRLAGIDTIDSADLARFEELDLVAQQAPTRAVLLGLSRDWPAYLGPDRAKSGWPWHSLAERGVTIVFGSDSPEAPLDPMLGLHAAATRTSPDLDAPPLESAERLPVASAIDAYTRDAAYASFDELRKGVLAPGMLADIVVLSTDILALSPDQLLDGQVDVTIFDGKVVFERQVSPLSIN